MTALELSVCTIYANRQQHLQNLVASLIDSKLLPKQLVIICMNDRLPKLPQTPFAIATATIDMPDSLPLSVARNRAAALATERKLVFLDVDCICDRHLLGTFDYHLESDDALYSGSVKYLQRGWQQENWTWDTLERQSALHHLQGSGVNGRERVAHPYELFWSLCFGIKAATFEKIGGFNGDYLGYGGEDTDFAFQARSHQLPHYKIGALAYHQFHASYAPPLNHLADIVSNARVFYRKWNILPMEKWLRQFADMGYITLQGSQIEIIRLPTETEITACLKGY